LSCLPGAARGEARSRFQRWSWSDPLALLADQALFAFGHEQLIEALTSLAQPRRLQFQNGGDLALPLHPLLIGPCETEQAHTRHGHQAQLHRQANDAAEEFSPLARQVDQFSVSGDSGQAVASCWCGGR
jgi:hypothetical protein